MATGSPAASSGSSPRTGGQPAGTYVEYSNYIEQQIRRTRSQVKGVDLTENILLFLAGLLGFFLVAIVLDHWVISGGLGFWGRLVCFVAIVGYSGWFIAARIVPLMLRRINPVYAARAIETSAPTLKNSLVNFLMLRSNRDAVPDQVFQAVEQQAARRLSSVSVESSVDHSRILKFSYVLAAFVVVGAIYKIVSPKDPLETLGRVTLPWASIQAPSRIKISEILPGSTTAYRGQQVEVSAEIRGLRAGEHATLYYTTADGQHVDQPIKMQSDEGGYVFKCKLPASEAGLQQDLVYYISAGDAKSLKFDVRAVAAPTIVVETVEYEYPSYTELPKRTVQRQGDIEAIEGTRVTITARANQPIKSANINLDCDTTRDLIMSVDGQSAKASFTLAFKPGSRSEPAHQSYQIEFTNDAGQTNFQPTQHKINVLLDLAPEVTILSPDKHEIEVPQNSFTTLEIRAIDPDYKLASLKLIASRGNQEIVNHEFLPAPQHGQLIRKFDFVPAKLLLQAGDELQYWLTAEDNKRPEANAFKTATLKIRIVDALERAAPPPQDLAQNDPEQQSDRQQGKVQDQQREQQPQQQKQQEQEKPTAEENQQSQDPAGNADREERQQPNSREQQQNDQQQQEQHDSHEQTINPKGADESGAQQNAEGSRSEQQQEPQQSQRKIDEQDDSNAIEEILKHRNEEENQRSGDQQEQQQPSRDQAQQQKQQEQTSPEDQERANDQQESGGSGDKNQGEQQQNESGEEAGGGTDEQSSGGSGSDQNSAEGTSENAKGSGSQQAREGQKPSLNNQSPEASADQESGESGSSISPSEKPGNGNRGSRPPVPDGEGGEPATDQERQAPPDGDPQQLDRKAPDSPQNSSRSKGQPSASREPADRGSGETQNGAQEGNPSSEQQETGNSSTDAPMANSQQGEQSSDNGASDPSGDQPDGKGTGNSSSQDSIPESDSPPASDPQQRDANGQRPQGRPQSNQSGQANDTRSPSQTSTEPQDEGPDGSPATGEPKKANELTEEDKADDLKPGSRTRDPEKGDGQSAESSDSQEGNQGGTANASDLPKDPEKRDGEESTQNSKPDGGTNEAPHGSSGAGQSSDDSAPPQSAKPPRPSGSKKQPTSDQKGPPDESADSAMDSKEGGKRESDSSSDDTKGDRAGGGGKGAGQAGKQAGRGAGGDHTSADEGKGAAQEQGEGETGQEGGEQVKATRPTGKSGSERGPGSAKQSSKAGKSGGNQSPDPSQQPGQEDAASSGQNQSEQEQGGSGNTEARGRPSSGQLQPPGESRSSDETGDDPNLEYARKATDLALEHLRDQMDKGEESKLLDKLGWTDEEARRFLARWDEMRKRAEAAGPDTDKNRQELNDALRSLGLRPTGTVKRANTGTEDQMRGLQQGERFRAPAGYEDHFRAFRKQMSRGDQ